MIANLVAISGLIVGLAASAGFAFQRGVVTGLRGQAEDYERRIAFLEGEQTRKDAAINQLTSDLDALKRIVTGEVQWTAINDLLEHHHADAGAHWVTQENLLEEIRDLLVNGRRAS